MATSIKTSFESIILSSHLPEEISIRTDAVRLEVNIYVGGTKVFKSVYYPFDKMVYVRDIRSIVEASLYEKQLVMASLRIEVYEPAKPTTPTTVTIDENGNYVVTFDSDGSSSPDATISDVKVVYSQFKTSKGSEGFLYNSFLTTRKSAVIPRNGKLKLCNYAKAYAQGSNYALIYYSHYAVPGVVFTYKSVMSKIQSTSDTIVTSELTHDYFKSIVDQVKSTNCEVLGVEYQIGMRRFNIFFTDEEPTETFKFLNAFNIMETAYLYNTTTTKTEVDRSETVCGRQTQFYDETVKVKHEVETAPLTHDEAMWLNQILTSKLVMKPVDNYSTAEILISDISSEISDSDKELIRMKFSWRYADSNEWI